eukprot:Opistho-2@62360
MASLSGPCFFLRASDGLAVVGGALDGSPNRLQVPSEFGAAQKCTKFSPDGNLLASSDGSRVVIWNISGNAIARVIPQANVLQLVFSPKGSFLVTWERYAGVGMDGAPPKDNVNVWSLETGEQVHRFISRRSEDWEPQWTPDENAMIRLGTGEVHAYEPKNFIKGIVTRLEAPGAAKIAVSQGPSGPHKLAVFVPGSKGAPSTVKLYNAAALSQGAPIASKSFYKADKVVLSWNPAGSAILIFAQTDVDTSGKSYYGETCLYLLRAGGDYDANIQLGKEGPIYDYAWSPDSKDFVVVYGFMPAKATLYDHTCKPIFDFGTGSRNTVQYNPHGNVIMLGGFGNLRGEMEFWDRRKLSVFAKCQASDSTHTEWCPDGTHILTCTTSPRLRVGNGYKVWRFSQQVASGQCQELWEARWQPRSMPAAVIPSVVAAAVSVQPLVQQASKPAAYRPPHLRGTDAPSQPSIKLHELEAPKRLDAAPAQAETLSKAALKNKKKREAKAKGEGEPPVPTATQAHTQGSPAQSPIAPATEDPELAKKIKNLTKKLKQIEVLREEKRSGKNLEVNQLQKLETEAALRAELVELESQLNR